MTEVPSPSFLRRIMALVYDTCLIIPLILFCLALATGVQVAVTGVGSGDRVDSVTLHPQLVQILALLTVAAFYCGFWSLKGQTLGMQAWRIRLRSQDGAPLTLQQGLQRCLAALVSLAVLGAGYWWCLFDKQGHYWHDRWSGTELELLPKAEKSNRNA